MKHFKLSPEDNYMHTTSPLQETEGRFRYTPQERAASSVRKAFATDRTFVITEVQRATHHGLSKRHFCAPNCLDPQNHIQSWK